MNPAAPVTSARTGPPYRWVARTPNVALAAAALIAVQLVIRAVLAFRVYFYWDDLILVGRASTHGLLSPSYLFDDHDGHIMPAAFLVAGAITRLAPLNWIGPAISLLVLQLLASLALLRALGYRRAELAWLVLAENSFLLLAGLAVGSAAALLSILPQLVRGAGSSYFSAAAAAAAANDNDLLPGA